MEGNALHILSEVTCMWVRSFIVIFLFTISQVSYATICEQLILDDFNFRYESGELQTSLRNKTKQNLKIEFLRNKKGEDISGTIQVKDAGKTCYRKDIEIPPIKLCRDESNNIAPWRFITYGDSDILSVIALTADVSPAAILYNSRICNSTKIAGRVYVQDSNLFGGDIEGIANTESIPGTPDYPNTPGVPGPWDPSLIEKLLNPKALNYNYYTVKLVEVEILGNPTILGIEHGVFLKNVVIENSPEIIGGIFIETSTIINNGMYHGDSIDWDGEKFVSILRKHKPGPEEPEEEAVKSILEGTNNFSGTYFVEREVKNSIIGGGISRNPDNTIDMIAYVSQNTTPFSDSYFHGFGHIAGSVQGDTNLYGYKVGPITYGIFFVSGSASNSASLEGALWAEDVTIEYATIKGNGVYEYLGDLYGMEIVNSGVSDSQIRGSAWIHDSSIYMSTISGSPHINNATLSSSRISCNANVSGTYYGLTAGCGFDSAYDKVSKRMKREAFKVTEYIKKENKKIQEMNYFLENKATELKSKKLIKELK